MSDNRERPYSCECGFWDRDRPHSAVGGGNCEYAYRRRTARVDNTGDYIPLPDEVVDLNVLLAERRRHKMAMTQLAKMADAYLAENQQLVRAIQALLDCPDIADNDHKDEETHAAERMARAAIRARAEKEGSGDE